MANTRKNCLTKMKKAVIFDLDGTLWDCSQQIVEPWNQVFCAAGLSQTFTHADSCACMGKTVEQIAEMLFPQLPLDQGIKLVEDCCEAEIASLSQTGGSPYPLLRESLQELKKSYHLYIVSNCQDGYIQAFLSYHDYWDLIEDFECIGRTGRCKGDNIRLVMERNGINAAFYVGDTASDQVAAEHAGIPFLHANYGFGKVEDAQQLERISDIAAKAKQIFS
ncbi:MAG: HAD family hydrolase [Oscillospiraceae bacterium]|nr:HAD family hydrolase [Oscillospiraceae bacterium]